MSPLIFFSSIYWLNFAILIGVQCIDFISVFYFYIFLLFFVFPVGNCVYKIFFNKVSFLERSYLVIIQILLAIPIIAVINSLFGIDYILNLGILFFSYAYILYSRKSDLSPYVLKSRVISALRSINMRGEHNVFIFLLILTVLSTIISLTNFKIYNYYPGHVSIFGHPSDGSTYYAILSGFVNHTGSFIHGYKSTLFAGANLTAFRFLFEIFESVFIKFSSVDIVLFQSVIIAQSLMLLLFSIAFLPCYKFNSSDDKPMERSWNSIFFGLVIVAIFTYFRQISLFAYSTAAFHSFLAWMYILIAIKLFLSSEKLFSNRLNTDWGANIALVSILFLIGVMIHVVYTIILFISFVMYLLYRLFNERQRKQIVFWGIWIIVISVVLLSSVVRNIPLVFGDLRISIHAFSANVADIQRYFNDLAPFKPIYSVISSFINSDNAVANIVGSFYALVSFMGYFFIIPIYYFVFTKSKFKFFFANMLLGIYIVLLFLNYQLAIRPSFLAMYMPNVTMLVIVFIAMEIVLSNKYFHFFKTPTMLKIGVILSLTAAILFSNSLALAKPSLKLDISKNLYAVIMYAKNNTPRNSVILHNLKNSDYYAYFSGFAYRNVVLERGAYAYAFIDNEKEVRSDIEQFCSTSDLSRRQYILNKYSVSHVLSSPECHFVLPEDKFRPVFSNSEYMLYQYLK